MNLRVYDESESRSLINPTFVVVSITILGLLLRFYNLGFKSLLYDEAVLYQLSTGSFLEALTKNALVNSAPPLYVILINITGSLYSTEFFLRLISCFASIAVIPLIYILARNFTSPLGAYVAAFIVAISTSQIRYAQLLREYSLTMALTVVIIAAFLNFLAAPQRRQAAILSTVLWIGIFTQYGLALLVLALNLVFVLSLPRRPNKRELCLKWTIIQSVTLVAVVLVYFLSLQLQWVSGGFGATAGSNYLAQGYWDGTLNGLIPLLFTNTHALQTFAIEGILPALLCIGGIVVIFATRQYQMALLLLLPIAVNMGTALLRFYPYIASRQNIFLLPMIYVAIGIGFDLLVRKTRLWVGGIIVALILVTQAPNVINYLTYEGYENMRPLVNIIMKQREDTDRYYVYYGAIPAFNYYFRYTPIKPLRGRPYRGDSQAYVREVNEMLRDEGRIWLIFSHCHNAECRQTITRLSRRNNVELMHQGDNVSLYLIHEDSETTAAAAQTQTPVS